MISISTPLLIAASATVENARSHGKPARSTITQSGAAEAPNVAAGTASTATTLTAT
ncbi:hypothetical protein D3C83_334950 [compost metagenome]